jgi:site-specific recombinase
MFIYFFHMDLLIWMEKMDLHGEMIDCGLCHRIGWWENLQESPIFDGKNPGFL